MPDITTWISAHGVTEEMLGFLLFIPIMATIVNVTRYIVGLKILGIYAPMTLAFAYYFTGIRFGLLVTVAVIGSTLLTYTLLKRIRMHYISRITVNYIIITMLVILIITLNQLSPVSFTTDRHNPEAIPPLGVLLIAALSDFFIKKYVKKGVGTSLRLVGETVILGLIGWSLLRLDIVRVFLIDNLWINFVLLGINLVLGQYIGLRFTDLLRFRKIGKENV